MPIQCTTFCQRHPHSALQNFEKYLQCKNCTKSPASIPWSVKFSKTMRVAYNRNILFVMIIVITVIMRRDVLCGTLHCQGGLDKPIVDGGVTHINMQVHFLSSTKIIFNFNKSIMITLGGDSREACGVQDYDWRHGHDGWTGRF